MKSRLLSQHDATWSEFLQHNAHDFYHLPAYLAVEARHEGGNARALYVEDGEQAMLLPLIVRPLPGPGFDATSPNGYAGPLMRGGWDPSFFNDALAAGSSVLASAGVISVFVRLHPLLNPDPHCEFGTLVQHADSIGIDLSQPTDVLWGQMRRNHRTQIRQALEAGHVAEWDETWSHFEAFKQMYAGMMDRKDASEHYRFDDAYFDGLRSALGQRLRLAVVRIGSDVAAAGLFTETCGIVEAHLTASDGRSGCDAARATKLMFHFVSGWAKARGNLWMHLGSGRRAEDDSLLHFKAGFSPRRLPFHTLRAVVSARSYERLVVAQDPAADLADLSGFFPAYRGLGSPQGPAAVVARPLG